MKKIILSLLSLFLWTIVGFSQISKDSKGTDFWLMFNSNESTSTPILYISSAVNTSGVVSVPGIAFTQPFTVVANTVTVVTLPTSLCAHSNDVVDSKGIHVTSLQDIAVYGLNRQQFTTDAYLGLPIDAIGNDYIVLSYKNTNVVNGSELGIVGTVDGTVVTITPRLTTLSHTAGVPYNITLNQGETYELQDVSTTGDVTGTSITSTQPIGVMGASRCANIPAGAFYCDHICEMLPPISAWGKNFGAVPLAERNSGDTWRFLASEDGTIITVDGVNEVTINRGQYIEKIITARAFITSNKPILVAQYCNGITFGNSATGDPFMMLVSPLEQYLSNYTVSTVPGFSTNYINITAPTSSIGSITLDGAAVNPAAFIAIGVSGQSGAQITVTDGSHTLNGASPFGVFQYGFTAYDSYGYSGGGLFGPVSYVANLSLNPTSGNDYIGALACFNATVTDQNGNPLSGVRVDFVVTGANPSSGYVLSDSLGVASYCYTGNNVGNDTIVASQASLNAAGTYSWQSIPTISCPGSIIVSNTAGQCGANVTFTAVAAGTPTPTITYSQDSGTNFPVGTTTVTATATNIYGTDSCTFTITVNDVTPPTIACAGNITVNNTPGQCGALVTFATPTATDNCSGGASSTSYNQSSCAYAPFDMSGSTLLSSGDDISQGPFALPFGFNFYGTTYNSIYTSTNGFLSFTIPSLGQGCCQGLPLPNANLQNTIALAWTDWITSVTMKEIGVAPNRVVVYQWNGSEFGAGGNVLGQIALFEATNEIRLITNNVNVTNSFHLITQGLNLDGSTALPVAGRNAQIWTAVNECISFTPGITAQQTAGLPSGSNFPVGTTTNTFTATDIAGNSTSCSFDVTVNDTEAPAAPTLADVTGECTATAPLATTTDNCAGTINGTTSDPLSYSTQGTHVIHWTFSDGHGNSTTANQNVVIHDVTPPTIVCSGNITVNNTPGFCSAAVTFATPAVTDNCSGGASSTSYNQSSCAYAPFDMSGSTLVLSGDDSIQGPFALPFGFNFYGTTYNSLYACTNGFLSFTIPSIGQGCCQGLPLPNANLQNTIALAWTDWITSVTMKEIGAAPNRVVVYQWNGSEFGAGGNVLGQIALFEATNEIRLITNNVNVTNSFHLITQGLNLDGSTALPVAGRNAQIWSAVNECISFTPGITAQQTDGLPSGSNFPIGTTINRFTATDTAGNSTSCSFNVTVVDNQAPVITSCPAGKTYSADLGACTKTFTLAEIGLATATDNCVATVTWSRSDGAGKLDDPFPFGITTITWTATDGAGLTATCSQTININKIISTTTVTVSPSPQQYSDKVTFVARVSPNNCGAAGNIGGIVTFKIGSLTMGTATVDINGVATLANVALLEPSLNGSVPTNGPLAPGSKIVTAFYSGTDVDYTVTNPTTSLTITCEDARAYYSGAYYSSTAGPTSSNATVTLSATIKDITAVIGDPAYDANSGDIRNATVSFINAETNAVIATVPIGLVNAGDTKVGSATYNWNTTISGDAQQFLIGIRVNNYYCRYSSDDDAIITVAKPLGEYFISGGGYLNLTSSAGIKAGTSGTKNNFGFNVKYNRAKTNLQGNMNIIVRRMESGLMRVYQIKGNVMTSLAVNENCPKTATFNGKANITDITNPFAPLTVDGNGTLQVKMTDFGEPGINDKIAITLWNKNGGVWYVSNWNGTTTLEQILGGGNLKVHGGLPCAATPVVKTTTPKPAINLPEKNPLNVIAYPNPFANNFMIDVKTSSQSVVNLKVYDMIGRLIEQRNVRVSDLETTVIGERYPIGVYNVIVSQEENLQTVRVVKR